VHVQFWWRYNIWEHDHFYSNCSLWDFSMFYILKGASCHFLPGVALFLVGAMTTERSGRAQVNRDDLWWCALSDIRFFVSCLVSGVFLIFALRDMTETKHLRCRVFDGSEGEDTERWTCIRAAGLCSYVFQSSEDIYWGNILHILWLQSLKYEDSIVLDIF